MLRQQSPPQLVRFTSCLINRSPPLSVALQPVRPFPIHPSTSITRLHQHALPRLYNGAPSCTISLEFGLPIRELPISRIYDNSHAIPMPLVPSVTSSQTLLPHQYAPRRSCLTNTLEPPPLLRPRHDVNITWAPWVAYKKDRHLDIYASATPFTSTSCPVHIFPTPAPQIAICPSVQLSLSLLGTYTTTPLPRYSPNCCSTSSRIAQIGRKSTYAREWKILANHFDRVCHEGKHCTSHLDTSYVYTLRAATATGRRMLNIRLYAMLWYMGCSTS